MIRNRINLPAAVFTIVFRKLIDMRFGTLPDAVVLPKGASLFDDFINPSCLYLYLLGAAFTYLGRHIRLGTLVTVARRLTDAFSKREYTQLRRSRSWVLRNLLSNRQSQSQALAYITSQIPSENNAPLEILSIINPGNTRNEVPCSSAPGQLEGARRMSQHSIYSAVRNNGATLRECDIIMEIDDDSPEKDPQMQIERGDFDRCSAATTINEVVNMSLCENPEEDQSDSSGVGMYASSLLMHFVPSERRLDVFAPPEVSAEASAAASPETAPTREHRRQRVGRPRARRLVPSRSQNLVVRQTRSGRIYSIRTPSVPTSKQSM